MGRFRRLAALGLLMLAPAASAADLHDCVPARDRDVCGCSDDIRRLLPDSDCESCGLLWTAEAEALFLRRSTTGGQPLLFSGQTGEELLNSSDLDFNYEAGERLSLICQGIGGWDVAISYFSVDGWDSMAEFAAGVTPYDLVVGSEVVFPAGDVRLEYCSRLYNTELNFIRPTGGWLSPLIGFRWIEMYDRYRACGTEFSAVTPFTHEIKTHNHLYGFQLGGEATLLERRQFRLESIADAGIYYNRADQRSRLDSTGDPTILAGDEASGASFVAEIGLTGVWQLSRHIALRGGYEVLWIEEVALAPQQIPVAGLYSPVAGLDRNGGVFYHGAAVGLELTW